MLFRCVDMYQTEIQTDDIKCMETNHEYEAKIVVSFNDGLKTILYYGYDDDDMRRDFNSMTMMIFKQD